MPVIASEGGTRVRVSLVVDKELYGFRVSRGDGFPDSCSVEVERLCCSWRPSSEKVKDLGIVDGGAMYWKAAALGRSRWMWK
jgi:hypothetical protein